MNTLIYDKKKFLRICRLYELSLVILHGSRARGTARPKSDVDIGILGRPELIREKYFDILGDFSSIFGDKCDPVFLNGAEPMIAYQSAVKGIALYEKSGGSLTFTG